MEMCVPFVRDCKGYLTLYLDHAPLVRLLKVKALRSKLKITKS